MFSSQPRFMQRGLKGEVKRDGWLAVQVSPPSWENISYWAAKVGSGPAPENVGRDLQNTRLLKAGITAGDSRKVAFACCHFPACPVIVGIEKQGLGAGIYIAFGYGMARRRNQDSAGS